MPSIDNHNYCAQLVLDRLETGGRVLDFGCGDGSLVGLLRQSGVDAFGCDPFAWGLEDAGPDGTYLLRMSEGKIPFPDEHFGVVISNQVIEHVSDLHLALSEMRRVLKPDGKVIAVFPHYEVWREGHTDIPLLHRFKPGAIRYAYAKAMIAIGVGKKMRATVSESAQHVCDFIDNDCVYRSSSEINATFSRYFTGLTHHEHDWMARRYGHHFIIRHLFRPLQSYGARKWGGLVLVAGRDRNEAAARQKSSSWPGAHPSAAPSTSVSGR